MKQSADIIVIGAGIAGASLAHELSATRSVILLEAENHPGYHATGRSAAVFLPTSGSPLVLALIKASRDFFHNTRQGFCDHPLLSPRSTMLMCTPDHNHYIDEALANGMQKISPQQALEKVPAVSSGLYTQFLIDPETFDIDVDALLAARLKHFKNQGGQIATDAQVTTLAYETDQWIATTKSGQYRAPIIVNAAGAWADQVANLAGLDKLGIQPKRRSAALIDVSEKWDVSNWPFTLAADERFYFRPIGKKLMISPADQTPCEPHDAWADDLALAHAIDDFKQATNHQITHIEHTWAGLRTFAPDEAPVVGFDLRANGFFWLAGQGGFGIETSPALSQIACALLNGDAIPPSLKELGINPSSLQPNRFISS